MKNKWLIWLVLVIIIVILVLVGREILNKNQRQFNDKLALTKTNQDFSDIANEGQNGTIKLSSTPGGEYIPKKIKVNLGAKVRIEGDPASLNGGMDTVIIDGYGIRKVISPGDNIIEFTANKPGTFKMYCANGMGNGELTVK